MTYSHVQCTVLSSFLNILHFSFPFLFPFLFLFLSLFLFFLFFFFFFFFFYYYYYYYYCYFFLFLFLFYFFLFLFPFLNTLKSIIQMSMMNGEDAMIAEQKPLRIFRQRKRVVQCAVNLAAKLQSFCDNQDAAAFRALIHEEVSH